MQYNFKKKYTGRSGAGIAGAMRSNNQGVLVGGNIQYQNSFEVTVPYYVLTKWLYFTTGSAASGSARSGVARSGKKTIYPVNNNIQNEFNVLPSTGKGIPNTFYIISRVSNKQYQNTFYVYDVVGRCIQNSFDVYGLNDPGIVKKSIINQFEILNHTLGNHQYQNQFTILSLSSRPLNRNYQNSFYVYQGTGRCIQNSFDVISLVSTKVQNSFDILNPTLGNTQYQNSFEVLNGRILSPWGDIENPSNDGWF